jgi:HAE1 family hydrophobic/amphiphilic exporter-1
MDLKRRLERIPRVRDVDINAGSFYSRERAVSVVLEPDRAALGRYGLTAQDFGEAVSREVRGAVGAQRIEVGGRETDVMLKRKGARDRTLAQLEEATLPSPLGSPVKLGDVATVAEVEGLSSINREDQQYVRVVSYEFRGPPRLAQRTHDGFMATISVPPGYWVGDEVFEWERDDSTRGLWLVFAVGVVLVVLAVAMVFDSVWAAAIIFLSLPVSLGGVVAAFWIAEEAFAREAAVGVILVVGLAVNQAILLVDAALEKRRLGGSAARRLSTRDVVEAAGERSGMIVLVTFTTLASLLPLAIGTDSASLFGAIALATVGGTIAGTLGAMFVVPAMVGGGRDRD